jgi:hypothetical protein
LLGDPNAKEERCVYSRCPLRPAKHVGLMCRRLDIAAPRSGFVQCESERNDTKSIP